MGIFSEEISKVAKAFGCSYNILSLQESEQVHTIIEEKYARKSLIFPLWERLNSESSVYFPDGWKLIEKFIEGKPILILFEPRRDKSVVVLYDTSRITDILTECTASVLYITNSEYEYLISFNDHDFLSGSGSAREWVDKLAKYNKS